MQGVLTGFSVILVLVGAGYLAARLGVLKGEKRFVLNQASFYVATPALLFVIISEADVSIMASPVVLIHALGAVCAAALFVVLSRLFFPRNLATTTLTATAAGYVNANNIGLPIGIYVLGEITYVPPLILLQVLIFAPVVLAILEATRGSSRGAMLAFGRAFRNPIIIASLLGLLVSFTGWTIPEAIFAPLEQLGLAAIPMVLLAFGASLHGQPILERGSGLKEAAVAVAIKSIVFPVMTWVLAGPIMGFNPEHVYAAVVLAALPSAQNVYNFAATYRKAELVVRNVVLFTTFASLPVIFVIAVLLKP